MHRLAHLTSARRPKAWVRGPQIGNGYLLRVVCQDERNNSAFSLAQHGQPRGTGRGCASQPLFPVSLGAPQNAGVPEKKLSLMVGIPIILHLPSLLPPTLDTLKVEAYRSRPQSSRPKATFFAPCSVTLAKVTRILSLRRLIQVYCVPWRSKSVALYYQSLITGSRRLHAWNSVSLAGGPFSPQVPPRKLGGS